MEVPYLQRHPGTTGIGRRIVATDLFNATTRRFNTGRVGATGWWVARILATVALMAAFSARTPEVIVTVAGPQTLFGATRVIQFVTDACRQRARIVGQPIAATFVARRARFTPETRAIQTVAGRSTEDVSAHDRQWLSVGARVDCNERRCRCRQVTGSPRFCSRVMEGVDEFGVRRGQFIAPKEAR